MRKKVRHENQGSEDSQIPEKINTNLEQGNDIEKGMKWQKT